MKNYVAVDSLNPNAISARYGRPAALCGVFEIACVILAESDEEAIEKFDEAVDSGLVGYSSGNTQRVNPRLYRSKEWYRKGAEGRQIA
jgi:hypothetical protein